MFKEIKIQSKMDRNNLYKLHNLFIKNNNFITIQCFEEFLYEIYLETHTKKLMDKEGVKIDIARMDILCDIMPINSLITAPVEVRPSSIHGNGVFATRNINVGEFITFYPGDVLLYEPEDKNSKVARYWSERYIFKHNCNIDKIYEEVSNDYWCKVDNCYSLWGDPSFIDKPCYIGHIINDAPDLKPEKCNSQFHILKNGMGVAICSIKPIKKDEEILLSYGPTYWKNKEKE